MSVSHGGAIDSRKGWSTLAFNTKGVSHQYEEDEVEETPGSDVPAVHNKHDDDDNGNTRLSLSHHAPACVRSEH